MTATEKDIEAYNGLVSLFRRAKPSFEGAITPEESIKLQLRVIENLTTKDNGAFISHNGNKDWL